MTGVAPYTMYIYYNTILYTIYYILYHRCGLVLNVRIMGLHTRDCKGPMATVWEEHFINTQALSNGMLRCTQCNTSMHWGELYDHRVGTHAPPCRLPPVVYVDEPTLPKFYRCTVCKHMLADTALHAASCGGDLMCVRPEAPQEHGEGKEGQGGSKSTKAHQSRAPGSRATFPDGGTDAEKEAWVIHKITTTDTKRYKFCLTLSGVCDLARNAPVFRDFVPNAWPMPMVELKQPMARLLADMVSKNLLHQDGKDYRVPAGTGAGLPEEPPCRSPAPKQQPPLPLAAAGVGPSPDGKPRSLLTPSIKHVKSQGQLQHHQPDQGHQPQQLEAKETTKAPKAPKAPKRIPVKKAPGGSSMCHACGFGPFDGRKPACPRCACDKGAGWGAAHTVKRPSDQSAQHLQSEAQLEAPPI